MSAPVLQVRRLNVGFTARGRVTPAVRDLSFSVQAGETLAIVGESGSGKSLTAFALLGLVPPPGVVSGEAIALEGRNLIGLPEQRLREVRGARIAIIFQEPMTALNPVLTIGAQIMEAILEHERVSPRAAKARALELLAQVRIPDAERRFHDYPHRLSGGMRQRVVIAMALACAPAVLVADEPTTALDVTIQAQILELIDTLKREHGTAVVLITHDLGVVAEHADRVLVLYAGRKVEERAARDLFAAPLHPYTRGLIAARPRLGGRGAVRARLTEIPGTVPGLAAMPDGCAFAPRCPVAEAACTLALPPLVPAGTGSVACLRVGDLHAAEPDRLSVVHA